MENIFFTRWEDIARVILVGILAYTILIVMLRLTGKRTLSKMSAYDLVITIALGSTLSTVILDKDTSLAEGVTALGLLVLLQMGITWLSVRSEAAKRIIHTEPTLLLHQGEFCKTAMHDARVTKADIYQALRQQGIASPEQAQSVVLEANGKLSVINGNL